MSKRLEIAKNLLSKDGVIFISIDDNEQAQLKLLCDSIFGEQNLISILCIELSKTQGMKVKSAQDGRIVKNHEYIYTYTKNIELAYLNRMALYDRTDIWDSHFNKVIIKEDEKFKLYQISEYIKENHIDIYNMFSNYNILDKDKITEKSIRKGIEISEEISNFLYKEISSIIYQEMACSITIPNEIDKLLEKEKIICFDKYILTKTSNGTLRQYRSLAETIKLSDEYDSKIERVTIRGALWKGFFSDMMNIQKEGEIGFKNGKKPIRLISQLNKWANRKNSVILDFFAGSGTTGHAVAQLNKEDGGNRRYILCTNNENGICENVTYQRLKNIQEDLPHKLKYLKTDFIDRFSDEDIGIKQKLIPYIKVLIELEYGCEIDNIHYLFILTEEELEHYLTEDLTPKAKIFIAPYILLDQSQHALIHRKQAALIDIPEYYFRNELVASGEL